MVQPSAVRGVTEDRLAHVVDATGTPSSTTFLRGDGAWATPSGSGGSSFAPDGTYTKYVAGSGESADVKDAVLANGGYVCDGTDDEVQINAALASVGTETINKGGNGGKVILVGRNFDIGSSILMPTQTKCQGAYGMFGTRVYAQSGITGGAMVKVATTDTQYVEVCDMMLDGANRASTDGIYFGVATGQEYDAFLVAHHIYFWQSGQDSLSVQNLSGGRTRGNHFSHMRSINAGRYGVHMQCPDSFYDSIDVGSAGSHGWYIAHANNRIVNSKSWYSDGSGFYLTSAGRDNQLSACESQDNEFHGYYIAGRNQSLSSCCADSNSYDGSSSGSITGLGYNGFEIVGQVANVHGSATDKNEGGRGARQDYGVRIGSGFSAIVNVTTYGNRLGSLQNSGLSSSIVNVI